jgi:hypothetical protein
MSIGLTGPSATTGAVFALGSDGFLYYLLQSRTPPGRWSGPVRAESLPEGSNQHFAGPPSASTYDGIAWAAIRGTDGLLYTTGILPGIVGALGEPGRAAPVITADPIAAGNFAVAPGPDGTVIVAKVFGPGSQSGLWQALSPPVALQGKLGAGVNSKGLVEVFSMGVDGNLWHTWQTEDVNTWSQFYNHGPVVQPLAESSLSLVTDAVDCLQLFCVSDLPGTPALYQFPQTAPSNGWATAAWIQGAPYQVAVAPALTTSKQNNAEMLLAFVQAPAGPLWVIYQNPGAYWRQFAQYLAGWDSSPNNAASLVGAPTAALGTTGNVEIFVSSSAGDLWHIWQTRGAFSVWSEWFNHGQIELR